MRSGSTIVLIGLAVLLFAGGAALAERVTLSGTTYYVTVQEEDRELPGCQIMRTSSVTGFAVAQHQTYPRNGTCFTSSIIEADGEVWNGGGYCYEVDEEGDATWLWLKVADTGGTWGFIKGTGKYEGISGGGTSKVIKMWGDGKFQVSWEADYELR